jgi:hypothetical protein
LGEPQQREARLRLATELTRFLVRRLGRVRVSLQSVELSLLVERLSGRRSVHRLLTALTSQPRLFQRIAPRPVQLFDSGAMGETPAGEGHHLGLILAPAGQCVRPFTRPTGLEGFFTGGDDAAVDGAGEERRRLAGSDDDHRLVQ